MSFLSPAIFHPNPLSLDLESERPRWARFHAGIDTSWHDIDAIRLDSIAMIYAIQLADGPQLEILSVNEQIQERYPEAPFRSMMMEWYHNGSEAAEDTLLFTPANLAREFEVLRQEDEAPEGCPSPEDSDLP